MPLLRGITSSRLSIDYRCSDANLSTSAVGYLLGIPQFLNQRQLWTSLVILDGLKVVLGRLFAFGKAKG